MMRTLINLTSVLSLSACDDVGQQQGVSARIPETEPASSSIVGSDPAGPELRTPAIPPEEMGAAADISQFEALPSLNAKIFSLSGGDPAVNGLVTYLGLYAGPADGWRTYPLGDYAEWRVVEADAGRIVLAVRQDTAGPDGDILKRSRRVSIDFTMTDEMPQAEITVRTTP